MLIGIEGPDQLSQRQLEQCGPTLWLNGIMTVAFFVEMLHCTDVYDYVDSEKEPLGFKTIQTMCWECSCCMSHVWFLGVNNRILTLFGFVMNPHTVLIVAAGLVQHRAGYDHFRMEYKSGPPCRIGGNRQVTTHGLLTRLSNAMRFWPCPRIRDWYCNHMQDHVTSHTVFHQGTIWRVSRIQSVNCSHQQQQLLIFINDAW